MSRQAELKAALEAQTEIIERGMANAVKVEEKGVTVSKEDADTIRNAMAKAAEIKMLMEADAFPAEMKAWMERPTEESIAKQAMANDAQFFKQQMKTIGQMFVESKEFKALQASGGATMTTPFEVEAFNIALGNGYGRKDVYNGLGNHTFTHGFGSIQFDPMVPRPQRPIRVRDLFPAAATSANLIDFFQVIGWAENGGIGNAAPVADYSGGSFGTKPKSNLQFRPNQAPVRTIAHWEAAHRNVLDDEPQLLSTINNELLYGLTLVEDYQILNGSGVGEDLLGILNTPNIQTYTQGGGDLKSDALRRAATKAIIANYPPTGFVLHPYDWEDIELQRGDGDGQYMLFTNIAIGAASQAWRLPVVETPAMTEGVFLCGAFGIGAQLYDRQTANVRIAEQHADFFVKNAVAILCEERLALAVKRPESFVKGQFTTGLSS